MDYRAHGAPRADYDLESTPTLTPGFNAPPSVPVSILPPGVSPIPPQPPQVYVFPWWFVQWESAQALNVSALNFTVTAGQLATPANFITGFSYQVPVGNRSVVKAMKMTVENPVATTNLAVTLFKNGAPIQGWNGIAFDPVAATALILPFNDMNILLQQNDVFTAAFAEASNPASNWTCSLQAYGWTITQSEIDRVQGTFRY